MDLECPRFFSNFQFSLDFIAFNKLEICNISTVVLDIILHYKVRVHIIRFALIVIKKQELFT